MSREGYAPSQTHLIDIPREESQLWTFAFPRHMGEKRYFSFPAEPNMVCVQPTVQLQRNLGCFINPAFIEPFGLTLIEAAAHGLPIVATKNGGPVDIHRVLDNGLLVDPHDQQSVANALLKLVADKQLWGRCRQNGLKNIHLFSWPEHCTQKDGSIYKSEHHIGSSKSPALRKRKKDNYAGSVGFILSTSLAISEMHSLLGEEGPIVSEDKSGSTTHCYVFKVEKPELIPSIKELRKSMRIQALRCHVIYCQNGNKLNIIPVLASRSQALRYLHVRWGIDLSHVVVFVGEHGDTDYEGLLGGLHKTVILKGVGCSVGKHHAHRYYPLEDVVPFDSPNITQTEGCNSNSIRASLGKLGVLKV
ncbi:putative sucrose-phosphate synthase 1 [Vitis vinifera]|uniref:sucrose-phosphate synthase n=1 Tax=Vitis vinifera TaxID=29760 RepID=A0A438KF17_VITVI|nr:putative sucrose-phosphate synthase 1 [Vitis vinifera]